MQHQYLLPVSNMPNAVINGTNQVKATEIIESLLGIAMQQIVYRFSRDRSIDFHKRIADAIVRRDAQQAAELMDEHLSDVIRKLEDIVRNSAGA